MGMTKTTMILDPRYLQANSSEPGIRLATLPAKSHTENVAQTLIKINSADVPAIPTATQDRNKGKLTVAGIIYLLKQIAIDLQVVLKSGVAFLQNWSAFWGVMDSVFLWYALSSLWLFYFNE